MPQNIHPTAIIEDGAQIANDVTIGPYTLIGPHVVLEHGVKLHGHVVIAGRTTVGEKTEIYPFASIGHPPQDLKYQGEPSTLTIGKRNQIREHVTMNPGTEGGGMDTKIGDDCLFMIGAHVAHDCQVGNNVILANNASIAGHVVVGDHAILGGLAAVHQFVRIGPHAMIGGGSAVENDIIPFGLATGERAHLNGLNLVGLERRGFDRTHVNELRQAFKTLFGADRTLAERIESVEQDQGDNELVKAMIVFVREASSRALCQPAKTSGR
ncbi:MAG: acyl-ACP--UDP-N-acetylglucosamine O-acyltransferase [Pseudomonadota bacterium]